MNDWYEDTWLLKALEMGEEFYGMHRETMPEDPHDVWKENEIGYFTNCFVLWSARTKFELKHGKQFLERANQYRKNIKACIERPESADDWVDGVIPDKEEDEYYEYQTYLAREKIYIPVLMRSSASLLKTITGSNMKKACKIFIDNACKEYVFSANDLARIIGHWLIDKNVEFQRYLEFE